MKWFLDTEFYERPGRIDLISIGLVGSDGREVYAENAEFDWDAVEPDNWLQENVRPHLLGGKWRSPRQEIAELVLGNVGNKPEFWGWYCDYDWVVFCWLFGRMVAFKCPRCEAEIVSETAGGAVVMQPPKCGAGHPAVEMEQQFLGADARGTELSWEDLAKEGGIADA